MEPCTLDELDFRILNLISNDTRMSFLEVSRICNVSGAAVHQRVQKLIAGGIITGSEFKLDFARIGYRTCAYLSLRFDGIADIDLIAQQLSAIPEIVECHATVGECDFLIKIHARDNAHLLNLIRRRIKPLGPVAIQTTLSGRELFHRQMIFDTNSVIKK
jgi:Lrp/AsnC family transcriptional regulator for asnA, asnC and gidA